MKRLILIRHAKSGWDDPVADDHARVLTKRGRSAATAIGAWLSENGYRPDVVLCSDSARTQETASYILRAFDDPPELHLLPMLYHASPDTVVDLVSREAANTIAVIGHNPGIGMAAHGLVAKRPRHPRFSDYPTCATTVIDFADAIAYGNGSVAAFIAPRDLTAESDPRI